MDKNSWYMISNSLSNIESVPQGHPIQVWKPCEG
jgi:hypothetical protein